MEKIWFYIEENPELLIYPIMLLLLYISWFLANKREKEQIPEFRNTET